ncbi:MAG: ABC transporter permease [Ruminococcus sp.]|nr:ABC transporter permease [Ruminococcus sp.]
MTLQLLKRNFLIFIRDRGAVFFSILSMLIVLALMILFLGDMNSQDIVEILDRAGGKRDAARDKANAQYLIQMWVLAGILIVNSITVTMTVMGNMVKDESAKRLAGFYVAPVKRIQIALGYILAAWALGTFLCLVTLLAGEGYMLLTGHELLPVSSLCKLTGMIVLNTFVYAAIAYLIALFVHSDSAWGGLLTVVGTLVGFVGAIYLPMSVLPEKVAEVLKYLPVLHGAAMMRIVCVEDALAETFAGLPEEAADIFKESMGISIIIDGSEVSFGAQFCYLLLLGLAVTAAAALITRKRMLNER